MSNESDCTLQFLESQIDFMRQIMRELAQAFDEALLELDAPEADRPVAVAGDGKEADAAAA
jgi:hypothetical protein